MRSTHLKTRSVSITLALTLSLSAGIILAPTDAAAAGSGYPMYRMYNKNSGEHFYTKEAAERDNLTNAGWYYEGTGWVAPETSTVPVYRLYNKNAGDHHYTLDSNERAHLISVGWNDEGIGWYSDDSHAVTLYRQYNPNAKCGAHNYTVSKAENDYLASIGWRAEGTAWYGTAGGTSETDPGDGFGRHLNADALIAAVNARRSAAGLSPVAEDLNLDALARSRSSDLSASFSHMRPGTQNTIDFSSLSAVSVSASALGECIAAGQKTADAAVNEWAADPKNSAILLDGAFTKAGAALYFDPDCIPAGRPKAYGYYWVIILAG